MLLSKKENTRISKILSYVLRHKPEEIGLSLDENGWVETQKLITAISNNNTFTFNLDILKEIVETCDKQRYSFSADMSKIRANQGHSLKVDLNLNEVTPPNILFHGTSDLVVDDIRTQGILKMSRQHVHLSSNFWTASDVARRHKGSSIVYTINCSAMCGDGYKFYLSENGVWLTDEVPTKYIVGYNYVVLGL